MITREESLAIVREHVKNENLLNHMIAVGAIMKGLAEHFGEDPVLWEAVGILHDVDYETFGEDFSQHGAKSAEMVKDLLPEDGIKAILSHNELTGNKAETRFDISLLAADGISGMIVANALVRPTKLEGMKAKSIKGRMKDKSFARQVSRENIMKCEEIGLMFNEFAQIAIDSMEKVASEIGLSA
ncbi:HD domain-containing protein [Candidatus Bathyarchaeota archaeon]|jgi:putative nucleotidyltransferase with HDIG domain|nr:HD domain-containing protein [Candidatus Bathyarchaeota archaeon]TFH18938.1 MAG: HD domain-containing protein [Candidatus Bathyarchaeota archaeon]